MQWKRKLYGPSSTTGEYGSCYFSFQIIPMNCKLFSYVNNARSQWKQQQKIPKCFFFLRKWAHEEYRTIRRITLFYFKYKQKKPQSQRVYIEWCSTYVTLCKVYSLFMISSWWGLDETQLWNKLYVYNRHHYLFITLNAYITCLTDLFFFFFRLLCLFVLF